MDRCFRSCISIGLPAGTRTRKESESEPVCQQANNPNRHVTVRAEESKQTNFGVIGPHYHVRLKRLEESSDSSFQNDVWYGAPREE